MAPPARPRKPKQRRWGLILVIICFSLLLLARRVTFTPSADKEPLPHGVANDNTRIFNSRHHATSKTSMNPTKASQTKKKSFNTKPSGKKYIFYDSGDSYHDMNFTCPVKWEWTTNIKEADVVWNNILDGEMRGPKDELPRAYPGQLFAHMSLESGVHYPRIYAVHEKGYNFSVDYRIWPGHKKGIADIPAVYMFNPTMPGFEIDFRKPPKEEKRTDAFLAAFISNCASATGRGEVLEKLMELIPVHSYGRCMRNMDEPLMSGLAPRPRKQKLSSDYLFLFTPENSVDTSYVTEKVYDAFAAGAIPVYMGAPDINRFVPDPLAIINVADYKTTEDLAAYLLELSKDRSKYLKHFEWKKKPFTEDFKRVLRLATRTVQCRLAMTLDGMDHEADLQKLDICPPGPDTCF